MVYFRKVYIVFNVLYYMYTTLKMLDIQKNLINSCHNTNTHLSRKLTVIFLKLFRNFHFSNNHTHFLRKHTNKL